jgi:hypothetical protein
LLDERKEIKTNKARSGVCLVGQGRDKSNSEAIEATVSFFFCPGEIALSFCWLF